MEDQKVQTCDFYRTDPNLPSRFNNPDCFSGYGSKKSHPLYRTTNQTYGNWKPSVHDMPIVYKGSSHKFSAEMLRAGMYRDDGFNTALESDSRVTVSTATYHKKVQHEYLYHCGKQNSDHHGSDK